jgi:alginate O-acetyltransferase complex protein AlgI
MNPVMVWVPVFLCLIAFFGVKWIAKIQGELTRRMRLSGVIVVLLMPLVFYKYRHFLYNEIIAPIAGFSTVDLKVALPLGISFMTFTIISYVVDVYRCSFQPVKLFTHLLAYILFFPRLIAGPILRPSELIPQLLRSKSSSMSSVGLGLTLFTVGLIKKVVFADSIADAVNPVFDTPVGHSCLTYWLAILGYTLQIYCDFSGYTDMAIGSSMMLGIRLPFNFNKPYVALNLQDFWRRWHITLSRWLRDYLYIPLGGSRCSKFKYLSNILVTMVLCGLWHGANWTFLLWGLFHGLGLVLVGAIKFSEIAVKATAMVPNQLKWFLTFIFIATSWVFFRSPNVETAMLILEGAFAGELSHAGNFFETNVFFLTLLGLFAIFHRFDSLANIRFLYRRMNKVVLGVIMMMIWAIVIAVSTVSSKSFIYFDF